MSGLVPRARNLGRMTSLRKAGPCVTHKVRIRGVFVERLAHALEYVCIDVTGTVAKVGRHPALDLRGKDGMTLPVHFLDNPAVSGDGDALTGAVAD